ncbi:MAG TPA: ABC transporter permease [Candidatus Acetothermia bacterium]|nr:ABC transporter permease [Candidatus Acetothermia bacterium]
MIKRLFHSRVLQHFFKDPLAIIGVLILFVMLIGAIFAPLIAPQNPYDPRALSLQDSLQPPLWMPGGKAPFLLGTDDQGRDILSTILYGCRTSFTVGFSVVLLAGLIGVTIGLIAAFYGGVLDAVTMRVADTLFSFSTTLMAMLLLGIFKGGGIPLVILAIVIADWVRYARTMRGSTLGVKQEDYVEAARAIGSPNLRIMFRHILPNAIPPILVVAAVDFGAAVMLEATLSFLGVGVPINEPSLGMMIASGKNYIYAGMWWLTIFPGIALIAIVLGVNLLADWLREEINPRLKRG